LTLELNRTTFAPVAPAGPDSVTVANTEFCDPPTTRVGESAMLWTDTGFTARVAVFVVVPYLAVIVAVAARVTVEVVIVNVPVNDPAGMTTVAGTCALALLDVRLIVVGPDATALMLTVPLAEEPPATEVGETVRVERPGIATVMSWVNVTPPDEAEMTLAPVVTGLTANVALVAS